MFQGFFSFESNLRKDSIKQAENDSNKIEDAFNNDKKKKSKEDVDKTINYLSEEEKKKMIKDGELLIESIKDDDDEYEENYLDNENESEMNLTKKQRKEIENQKEKEILEKSASITKTFLYQFKACNPIEKFIKCTDFIMEKKSDFTEISNGVAELRNVVQKRGKKQKCLRMRYSNGIKKAFIEQIRIYMTNQFPSILQFVNYSIHHKKYDLFVEKKDGTLQNIIYNTEIKINNTNKLIIYF